MIAASEHEPSNIGHQIQPDSHPSPQTHHSSNPLWSLTLNEIQLKSGKSFGSMNMDEFLANLWSVDHQQDDDNNNTTFHHHHHQHVPPQPTHNIGSNEQQQLPGRKPLNEKLTDQQPCISIPSPLCKKTVDEVWLDIQRDEENPVNVGIERQHSLGEMTLEDFLVQAGVVQEAPPPTTLGLQIHETAASSSKPIPVTTTNATSSFRGGLPNNKVGSFVPYQMMMMMNPGVTTTTETSSSSYEAKGDYSRCKIVEGPPAVQVERRQRRMIKNRESAARSRARKQAYTMELELELNCLKEENSRLKQIVQEIEQRSREKMMRMKKEGMRHKKTDKLRSIRRTSSMSW